MTRAAAWRWLAQAPVEDTSTKVGNASCSKGTKACDVVRNPPASGRLVCRLFGVHCYVAVGPLCSWALGEGEDHRHTWCPPVVPP